MDNHQPRRRLVALLATPLLVGACGDLDIRPDLADGAAAVRQRVDAPIDSDLAWSADWSAPTSIDPSAPISLDALLAEAIRSNRPLRIALADIAAARADLAAAEIPPNPMVAFSLGFPVEVEASRMVGLAAMQQIAWLFGRDERVAAAHARLRATVLDAADRAVVALNGIRVAFADVVAGEVSLAARRDARAAAERILVRTEREVSAGLRSASDLVAERAALAAAIREEAAAAESLARERLALAASIGAPELGGEWTTDGVWPEPRPIEGDAAALATTRLDVLAAGARLAAALADAEAAGFTRLDHLSLGVEASREMSGDWAVGPAIEVAPPLFDVGDVRIARAAAALERSRIEADAARIAAMRDVATLRASLDATTRRLREGSEPLHRELELESRRIAAAIAVGERPESELDRIRVDLAESAATVAADRLAMIRAAIALERSAAPRDASPLAAGGAR